MALSSLFFFGLSICCQQKNKVCDFHAEKNYYFCKSQEIDIVEEIFGDYCEIFDFKCCKMLSGFH